MPASSSVLFRRRIRHWLDHAEVVHLEAQLLLGQIRTCQDHIIALEKAIESQASFHEDVDRLLAVPGFGLVVSWSILAEGLGAGGVVLFAGTTIADVAPDGDIEIQVVLEPASPNLPPEVEILSPQNGEVFDLDRAIHDFHDQKTALINVAFNRVEMPLRVVDQSGNQALRVRFDKRKADVL